MPPRAAPPPVKPGEIIAGKYRVGDVLGRGGMGVVLAGEHVSFSQRVAIKIMHPEGGAQGLKRFEREANVVVQLQSEHVCRVLDHGSLPSGEMYIVMERLDGEDLDQRVRRVGAFPLAEAVELILQACEPLVEAHLLGIVHRDLKPSNLFLTTRLDGSPCVKLLDFGISKVRDAAAQLTATGAFLGTIHFMSPEQLDNAKDVDLRSDVWSLGATFFEMLTGQLPFEGESLSEMALKIMYDPAHDIGVLRPELSAVAPVIARTLAKDPAQRHQNLAELALALERFAPPRAAAYVARVVAMHERAGWQRPVIALAPTALGVTLDDVVGSATVPHASTGGHARPAPTVPTPPTFMPVSLSQAPAGNVPVAAPFPSAAPLTASAPVPAPRRGGMRWVVGVLAAVVVVMTGLWLWERNARVVASQTDDDARDDIRRKTKKRKNTARPADSTDTGLPPLPRRLPDLPKDTPTSWTQATRVVGALVAARGAKARVSHIQFFQDHAEAVLLVSTEPVAYERFFFRGDQLYAPEPYAGPSYNAEDARRFTIEIGKILPRVVPRLPGKAESQGADPFLIVAVKLTIGRRGALWAVTADHERAFVYDLGGKPVN